MEIVRVKVPTFDVQIDYKGQVIVLSFRERKRNERLKFQLDIARAIELHTKTDRNAEDEAFYRKINQEIDNASIDSLEDIKGLSGQVLIDNIPLSLESLKEGNFPDSLYLAIKEAFEELNRKLNNIKAEASAKNDAPLIDSPQG